MILIVDDKPENLIALSKTLDNRGFQTDTALSGEEALRKVLKNIYELIILDVQMPGMDGFEVAEAISGYSKTADIPIIFLSAVNVSKKFIIKGYASGGRDYLVKPFDTDILVLKIRTFILLNQVQQSLQTEIERSKLAESKKDEFISIASHELKTPLTSVKGYLQLAEISLKKQRIDQAQMFLERSSKQVDKLNNLVADLLDTTKIESGKLNFNYQYFEVAPFLENAIDNIYQSYPNKKIQTCGPDLSGLRIYGDENRLEQVLLNYLSNAIKYAPQSDEVTLEVLLLPEKQLQISVTDHGIGISADRKLHLFEKFYRVEETSNRFQGLGIGLFICAEIIKRHQGTYGVESETDKGSTFYFCIPLTPIIAELN
ncbi:MULTISPECIES: hybrid sensor histidine kinase/response regulator [unclassified Mucilaginibacter]|uniref:sensor histidine kinase n=1 Tax=unclassified Mucilaginibacter TaxID=2617802 RepID=UPI002AC9BDFC|nr:MULTISPECIES: hybrid sensor histidine kinase/response regulator [unclassified Mucilaginibacter]MEB0261949.1 hybrid sensor histidine kinase/response regulator [Mucilaginibacter sp. 10I4]MEB0277249.1 hybrid sensor histidine kinase/response regulator [Mucilaginibacter sp. 10B2]MEB0300887.1 hybrid sensor histidine kinase/response regulator [Mucilaginibacter sp. 5C4]WPX25376.1 hybrid sensor histidine kinase/response regulator [Mucilaginibacter sp. 5C4]